MLKYHKRKSYEYKHIHKYIKKHLMLHGDWGWIRACCQWNDRRRMRIKAQRWATRHKCYSCQQKNFSPGVVEHVEKTLGIHLEAQIGYHPIDEIFPDSCRECRFIMRGGQH